MSVSGSQTAGSTKLMLTSETALVWQISSSICSSVHRFKFKCCFLRKCIMETSWSTWSPWLISLFRSNLSKYLVGNPDASYHFCYRVRESNLHNGDDFMNFGVALCLHLSDGLVIREAYLDVYEGMNKPAEWALYLVPTEVTWSGWSLFFQEMH